MSGDPRRPRTCCGGAGARPPDCYRRRRAEAPVFAVPRDASSRTPSPWHKESDCPAHQTRGTAALPVDWVGVYLTSRHGNWRLHSVAYWLVEARGQARVNPGRGGRHLWALPDRGRHRTCRTRRRGRPCDAADSSEDSIAPEVPVGYGRAPDHGVHAWTAVHGPCQRFARNCATRNLAPPHAPDPRQRLSTARL